MLSYGVGHAAKIGGKNPIQNFPSNKVGLFYDRWWWKMEKNENIKFLKKS